MRPRTAALAIAALALAGAACGSTAPATDSWTYGPTGGSGPGEYSSSGLRFRYPPAWYRATFEVVSSFSNVLVYLSTEPLVDPCDRSAGMIACAREAVAGLRGSGLLVSWAHWGFPGWSFDPAAGPAAVVGGRTATIADLPADERCRSIGGDSLVVVTIPTPDATWNWDEVRACLRGPDTSAARAQVRAMLDSATWN